MSQSIFQQACLIQLSTSCWQGTKSLESSVIEAKFNEKQSDWLSGRKYLVNPESLAPVKAVVSRARVSIDKLALPFPIKGLTLVPKEMLKRVDEGLGELKTEFTAEVKEFLGHYEFEREKAERNLAELFNALDYPLDISAKFKFEWRFLTLDVPGRSRILSAEIYEREKLKFQSMMEETRELAMTALREEFNSIVQHMLDRLTGEEDGKPKRFKASMIVKMQAFLATFDDRNLFDDDVLANLVNKAKDIVSDVSAEGLRENARLRKKITSKMAAVKNAIDKAIEDLPRRKIRLAA